MGVICRLIVENCMQAIRGSQYLQGSQGEEIQIIGARFPVESRGDMWKKTGTSRLF